MRKIVTTRDLSDEMLQERLRNKKQEKANVKISKNLNDSQINKKRKK